MEQTITRDIINSLTFYTMLGIVIGNTSPQLANKSMDEYVKMLKDNGVTSRHIRNCANYASMNLTAEFRSIYGIPSLHV